MAFPVSHHSHWGLLYSVPIQPASWWLLTLKIKHSISVGSFKILQETLLKNLGLKDSMQWNEVGWIDKD